MGIMNAPMMLAASSGDDVDLSAGDDAQRLDRRERGSVSHDRDDADRYGVYHRISIDRKTCSSSR